MKLLASAALLAVLAAGAAVNAQLPPAPPSLPLSCTPPKDPKAAIPCYSNRADLLAWASAHDINIDRGRPPLSARNSSGARGAPASRWNLSSADAESMVMNWMTLDWDTAKHATVSVWREYYQPKAEQANALSELFELQINCQTPGVKILGGSSYPERNRGGKATPLAVDTDWRPLKVGMREFTTVNNVCHQFQSTQGLDLTQLNALVAQRQAGPARAN